MDHKHLLKQKLICYERKKTISLYKRFHRDKERIFLKFAYDASLIKEARKLSGIKWSQSEKAWYVDFSTNVIESIKAHFKDRKDISLKFEFKENSKPKVSGKLPNPLPSSPSDYQQVETDKNLTDFETYLQHKRYSDSTIKSYKNGVRQFLVWVNKSKTIYGNQFDQCV